jgi:hypothetical protein
LTPLKRAGVVTGSPFERNSVVYSLVQSSNVATTVKEAVGLSSQPNSREDNPINTSANGNGENQVEEAFLVSIILSNTVHSFRA